MAKEQSAKLTNRHWDKLRDKDYREHFVAAQIRRFIPFQIRAIMKKRGISQTLLAEQSGLTQGVISRVSNPSYGKMTINTIVRIAAGLDMAFIGRFVPFSELDRYYRTLSEDAVSDIATFEEEDQLRFGSPGRPWPREEMGP